MATSFERFISRELSWLEFNQRVLDEALDPTVPLLERVKFLAIVSSNFDEFTMVRVGGLHSLVASKRRKRDVTGRTPTQQLAAVGKRAHAMVAEQYRCLLEDVEPALAKKGIRRLCAEDLTESHRGFLQRLFEERIYPVVTPAALQPGKFPLLRNLTLHCAVRLKAEAGSAARVALFPMEPGLSRFIRLPGGKDYNYILVEDVIRLFLDELFPGEKVAEARVFRITRNADMAVQEDLAPDLLSGMQDVLDARTTSDCVRLELEADSTKAMRSMLQKALGVTEKETYAVAGPLDLKALFALGGIPDREDLAYEDWPPQPSVDVDPSKSMFETIAKRDLLLYHPYEQFDPVVRWMDEAADDPDVIAIKQVLYRTSKNSPIVEALRRAAEKGKHVTAIVELKARFDEAQNMEWAQALERAGVQVIYGIKGLKTHAKICLVLRSERGGVRRYMHFGTGNYNEKTARMYADISYMTCDPDLGTDASVFFNTIAGYSQPQRFLKIQAAPLTLRDKLLELIEGEIERRKQGQKARIIAKMNSLVDPALIEALYRASKAGVKIQLNIRGICCLRPGVPGVSENITVTSIVDRFLEHARIYSFLHGGEKRVYISSADWMQRNLDRRVELLVPVDDKRCKDRLLDILDVHLRDTVKARQLLPDGTYERVKPAGRRKRLRSQDALYREACEGVAQARKQRPTVFEPHRPPSSKS